jgi:hypothetical protein
MDSLRPRIAEQAHALRRCIEEHEGHPVDLDEVMSLFSFDAMGEVVFGEDFDLMRTHTMLPVIRHRDRALALLGPIADAIWIACLAFAVVPFYGRVRDWFRMVAFCEERMSQRIKVRAASPQERGVLSTDQTPFRIPTEKGGAYEEGHGFLLH